MAKRKIYFMNSALSIPRTFPRIIVILFFSRWCFRPEVSLRNIVKCNVNRQGSEMEDHVQPKIGLVFITMRE